MFWNNFRSNIRNNGNNNNANNNNIRQNRGNFNQGGLFGNQWGMNRAQRPLWGVTQNSAPGMASPHTQLPAAGQNGIGPFNGQGPQSVQIDSIVPNSGLMAPLQGSNQQQIQQQQGQLTPITGSLQASLQPPQNQNPRQPFMQPAQIPGIQNSFAQGQQFQQTQQMQQPNFPQAQQRPIQRQFSNAHQTLPPPIESQPPPMPSINQSPHIQSPQASMQANRGQMPPMPFAGGQQIEARPNPSNGQEEAAGIKPIEQSGNNNLNGLKNVGTFMGYPEYTISGYQPEKPENAQEAVNEGAGRSMGFEGLKEFCQNEKNGADFYKYLAGIAGSTHTEEILNTISEKARKRSSRFADIYKASANMAFTPEDRNINRKVGFTEGLRLAVKEESKSLRQCAEIAENTLDMGLKQHLNAAIIEKLCQINELNFLVE